MTEKEVVHPLQEQTGEQSSELPEKPNAPIHKLHNIFTEHLAIDDDLEVLDVILATLLDRIIAGDPLWLMVIMASGGCKSEIFRTFEDLPQVYKLSNLTSRTFISGYEDKTGKAIRGIYAEVDGKILAISELSEILTKNHEERAAIFAQLRDLYDGCVVNAYGTSAGRIKANCTMGLVCGITSAIDMYSNLQAVLGERFVKIRPKWNMEKARDKAIQNMEKLPEIRKILKEEVRKFFEELIPKNGTLNASVTDEQKHRIAMYATFTGYMRTVSSNRSFREDATEWLPETEFPTRLSQQLLKLAKCLAIIRGRDHVNDEDMATVSRVAKDTINPLRMMIVQNLHEYGKQNANTVSEKLELSYPKTERCLETLTDIKLVKQSRQNAEWQYQLSSKITSLIDSITTPGLAA
jgi:hypothetical protein